MLNSSPFTSLTSLQLGPFGGALTGGFLYEYCFHEGGYKVDMLIDQYLLRK